MTAAYERANVEFCGDGDDSGINDAGGRCVGAVDGMRMLVIGVQCLASLYVVGRVAVLCWCEGSLDK